MQVNQQGNVIVESWSSYSDLTLEEKKVAVDLLFQHLGITIMRTNATSSGEFELFLLPPDKS